MSLGLPAAQAPHGSQPRFQVQRCTSNGQSGRYPFHDPARCWLGGGGVVQHRLPPPRHGAHLLGGRVRHGGGGEAVHGRLHAAAPARAPQAGPQAGAACAGPNPHARPRSRPRPGARPCGTTQVCRPGVRWWCGRWTHLQRSTIVGSKILKNTFENSKHAFLDVLGGWVEVPGC